MNQNPNQLHDEKEHEVKKKRDRKGPSASSASSSAKKIAEEMSFIQNYLKGIVQSNRGNAWIPSLVKWIVDLFDYYERTYPFSEETGNISICTSFLRT